VSIVKLWKQFILVYKVQIKKFAKIMEVLMGLRETVNVGVLLITMDHSVNTPINALVGKMANLA